MKIYVIGTCQAIPLAACLSVMIAGVPVRRFASFDDPGAISDHDIVFRQRNRRFAWTPAELRHNEILYPRLLFNAFHPDLVYIAGPQGTVPPPLGDCHSSLVLYAWQRGMSATDTVRLFSEPVFERLNFFNSWDAAKHTQLAEGRAVDLPLDVMLARWERLGCFMYTPNHPVLTVMADIARTLVQRAGLPVTVDAPEYYLTDPMPQKAVWPIYPEIGRRLGLAGVYAFKGVQPPGSTSPVLLDLDEFIERSFEAYAHMPASALVCPRLESPLYHDLESIAASERKQHRDAKAADTIPSESRERAASPYADLPASRFWRRAVERVPGPEVDPVGAPPFLIDRRARIATAGSCFAQNMSRTLQRYGYNYFVAESAPAELSADDARLAGYGVFSTRSGNIYTARQLLQLFDRAYGTFTPRDRAWPRPDGRFADPFRAQIEPSGFASVEELIDSREHHLAAVRTMFEQLDVLIFTLGLTEAWRSRVDGAVFSSAPGVVAGQLDASRYEFVNFTASDVRDDLEAFLARLNGVNPAAKVVLTVSPQPLIATYEPRHVLVSTTYTKAALRVAADEIERAHPDVWYFPGYELVAGAFNRGAYYESDLRTVTPEGLEHVMRLFLAHATADEPGAVEAEALLLEENRANMDVVCDEETIAYDDRTAPTSTVEDTGRAATSDYEIFLGRELPVDYPVSAIAPSSSDGMEALEPSSMRAPIDVVLPSAMKSRTVVTVPCTVENRGEAALASGGKHPVFLSYRWFDAEGRFTEVGHSIHTPLPATLAPGASVALAMRIAAPRYEGRYRLQVALLQSEVAWFDDVEPDNGVAATVEVATRAAFVPS